MYSPLVKKMVQAEKKGLIETLTQRGKIYSFLNPVSYLEALKHKDLFCKMDGLFSDGAVLKVFIKLLYRQHITRRSFDMTSLARDTFGYASETGKTVYFVASQQEEIEKAVGIIKENYPKLNIVGFRNGYFNSEEEKQAEARHIVEVNPDFLIVGLGIIRQEEFLVMVKDYGFQGIGFTCGGFIHQTAQKRVFYYPNWVNKYNLRFLYRMLKEKHTRKRYLKATFVFPIRFFWERIV